MADPQMDISLIIAAISNIVSSLSFFLSERLFLKHGFFPQVCCIFNYDFIITFVASTCI